MNRTRYFQLLKVFMIIGLVNTTGCSAIYYSGSTQNVALLKEKGSLNAGVSGNKDRVSGEVAYAVTDHIGLSGTGAIFFPQNDKNNDGGRGAKFEGGVLYYNNFTDNIRFETLGFLGFGNVENNLPSTIKANPNTNGKINANMFSFGIQPAIGYHSKYFQVAVSSKLFSLNYSNITGNLIVDNVNQVDYLTKNQSNIMLEPALTIRGGLENIKLQLQIGRSFNLTNSSFKMDSNFATLGLIYSL